MEVISVNLGEKRTIQWKNKAVETGIFKSPVSAITLGATDVVGDHVIDRRYHGGINKACYLFSADDYDEWKEKYPTAQEWNYGAFGENITVAGLNEAEFGIGDRYQIGEAVLEVSEPRQPCFKLGMRFGTQQVLKYFIAKQQCGVYMRVIKPGTIQTGMKLEKIKSGSDISIRDVFNLLYGQHTDAELIHKAIELEALAQSTKKDLEKTLNKQKS